MISRYDVVLRRWEYGFWRGSQFVIVGVM